MRKIAVKLNKIIIALLMIISTVNINASYTGMSVQAVGSTLSGYTPYGYTQIINQTINPNYNQHFQVSYKTELVNASTAKVYLYTHSWIATNTALGYALSLSVSLNGTDMTPTCNSGLWNGSTQYGVIVNSNNQNDSSPTDYRLGAYDNGDGTGTAHSWDVLYTFTVNIGASDQSISLNFGKRGSGFYNLGSICSTTYNLSLNRPVQEVPKHNLTVSVSSNDGTPVNNVVIKVDNREVFNGAVQSGSSKTITVEEEATYEVSTSTPDGYSTSISSQKGQVGKNDVNIIIKNERLHTHSWSSWTVVKEATCTEDGSRQRTCSCGEKQTEVIKAKGHSYSYTVTKNATCTSAGTKTGKCSACGNEITETIAALGHNFGPMATVKEPTCTADGTRQASCSRCSEKKTEVIAALGHNYSWKVVKEAGCTTEGQKEAVCSRCNSKKTEAISPLGHNYQWVTVKQATETSVGSKEYKCTRCGKVAKTEAVPKITVTTEPEKDEKTPVEEIPAGEQTPVDEQKPIDKEVPVDEEPTVEQITLAATEKLNEEFAKLDKETYKKKNWNKIEELYENALIEIKYINSTDETLYDAEINSFVKAVSEIEKITPRQPREFGTLDYVTIGVVATSMMITLVTAIVMIKQNKKLK